MKLLYAFCPLLLFIIYLLFTKKRASKENLSAELNKDVSSTWILRRHFPNGELFVTLFILWFALSIVLAQIANSFPASFLNKLLLAFDSLGRSLHMRGWDKPSMWPQLDGAFGIVGLLCLLIFMLQSFRSRRLK